MADRREKQLAAFGFFSDQIDGTNRFTAEDIATATGWTMSSVRTYLGKQWHDFIQRNSDGTLSVAHRFRRITEKRFLGLSTQRRDLFPAYSRSSYDAVLSFEFLLPLTQEEELRRSLDALFYRDGVRLRLDAVAEEIGVDELRTWVKLEEGATDNEVLDAVVELGGSTFFGYSISTVMGRFRSSDDLLNRSDAGALLSRGGDYLIDETTAVVRFIAPLSSRRTEHINRFSSSFVSNRLASPDLEDDAIREIELIHALFFNLFVEAVVQSVQGEDEIWLIETSPLGQQLYVWEQQ